MRFKKGTKVEVLNYGEAPCGEWRSAEIISGNGHTYSVQYNCSSMTNEAIVEKVSKKSVRPSPPLVKCIDSWSTDDVVEVNHAGCWKLAVVSRFLGADIYLVRLVASYKELSVHKFNIRARQCWQNNEWIMMQKGNSRVGKSGKKLSLNCYKMKPEVPKARNDCSPIVDGSGLRESHLVSSTSLKRVSPYCSSLIDTYPRKMRAVWNEEVLEKVDAVAYPSEHVGEKCMLASFNNGTNQYQFNKMALVKPNNGITDCLERIIDSNDSCSDVSSVGSCSVISSGPNKVSSDMFAGPCQDADSLCSDAESLSVGGEEEKRTLYPNEDIAARIHRLELHAYSSTLKAMYASGPLTWEQELLLTDLRISLHISNDEHLLEIRNLVSSVNGQGLATGLCSATQNMASYIMASVGGLHGLLPKAKHDSSLFQVWFERTHAVSISEHELPDSCCDITVTRKSSSRLSVNESIKRQDESFWRGLQTPTSTTVYLVVSFLAFISMI